MERVWRTETPPSDPRLALSKATIRATFVGGIVGTVAFWIALGLQNGSAMGIVLAVIALPSVLAGFSSALPVMLLWLPVHFLLRKLGRGKALHYGLAGGATGAVYLAVWTLPQAGASTFTDIGVWTHPFSPAYILGSAAGALAFHRAIEDP
jgi:hypothetical protein